MTPIIHQGIKPHRFFRHEDGVDIYARCPQCDEMLDLRFADEGSEGINAVTLDIVCLGLSAHRFRFHKA